ncbi:MAG: CpaF family protein [Planctomycetes bacterium]|nr:CpaF family protein [Planctomycetota bacterium]
MSERIPFLASDRPSDRPSPDRDRRFTRYMRELHEKLVTALNVVAAGALTDEQLRQEVRRAAEGLSRNAPELLTTAERERLVQEVMDEAFGLGPLEPLMKDPAVTDILINGPRTVYVERHGRLVPAPVQFDDDRHLRQVVQRIVGRVGRRVDESSPLVDARLPDGSRVNAVLAPVALDGTVVSIRRFGGRPLRLDDLVAAGALVPEMAAFLTACVRSRVNVVISGGTGSGKTTLLNALSAFIPDGERIVTIEDAAELRLQRRHVVRMETRPGNVEGVGVVTTRDLVRNALRMRPDRIIVGECRGPEALDMLQAMNSGHDGSMTTLHANDTRDAIGRIEIMVGGAGLELPIWAIRRQVASAVQVIVQTARLSGGVRKVTRVSEVTGFDGVEVGVVDLFGFEQEGVEQERAVGRFHATGARPRCLDRLRAHGEKLPDGLFERRAVPAAGARA